MSKKVWRIVLSYVLVAGLWIFFSDRLVMHPGGSPEFVAHWSLVKGFAFVVITALLLYFLILRLTAHIWNTARAWRNSERKFRTLLERIRDGILAVDVETMRIFMSNPALSEMLQYSPEELAGMEVMRMHPPELLPMLNERFQAMRQGITPPQRVLPIIRKDGSMFYVEVNTALIDLDGRRYTISVFRDMTERLKAQESLQHAKEEAEKAREDAEKAREEAETANLAKDQFISIISHELRTPLTPALAMVTALKEMVADQSREDLEIIRRNLELESMLIDDLLDITRITNGKIDLRMERTDLHAAIHHAVGICKTSIEAKGLQYTLQLEAANPYVWGDPPRLQQIFWGLLNNAVKFTPEGGAIAIRSFNEGPAVKVEVTDTGIGFDNRELPRLFLPFEQGEQSKIRRFGGLGLGLSIARTITELHKGTLSGSSEGKDLGSTFTLELPTTEPVEHQEAPASATSDPLSARILLVDDHADTLQILARLLRRWGYQVTSANTVQTALRLASKAHFDVLISDLALPDGSGCDIMREVKARYGVRGIALSGFGSDADREMSRAAGFEEHFVKPISFPPMRAALERIAAAAQKGKA
ncbi:MAG: ATP-binding protein [Chthoniobacteraceae bacterium]